MSRGEYAAGLVGAAQMGQESTASCADVSTPSDCPRCGGTGETKVPDQCLEWCDCVTEEPSPVPAEKIVAVSIVWQGHVATLPPPMRHHHLIAVLAGLFPGTRVGPEEQGFVTSTGRHVSREVGAEMAISARQMSRDDLSPTGLLFSEDLW